MDFLNITNSCLFIKSAFSFLNLSPVQWSTCQGPWPGHPLFAQHPQEERWAGLGGVGLFCSFTQNCCKLKNLCLRWSHISWSGASRSERQSQPQWQQQPWSHSWRGRPRWSGLGDDQWGQLPSSSTAWPGPTRASPHPPLSPDPYHHWGKHFAPRWFE